MTDKKSLFFIGIDIGSSATKLVVLDAQGEIFDMSVVQQGVGSFNVENLIGELKENNPEMLDAEIYQVATGYGRLSIKDAVFQKSEISCHAKGVARLIPDARTIIDIGGQDCKAIALNSSGNVREFVMNDKCAAGTGRFLDVMSRVLNVELGMMGEISSKAEKVASISNTCTVFAESEVISCLSKGEKLPDIIAGIHHSVASKASSLAKRIGINPRVVLTGGVAQNEGVLRALSEELGMDVSVPEIPQFTGALGAALFCFEDYMKKQDDK